MADQQFHLRRAEPGATFTFTQADGSIREIKADEGGVVTPETAEDDAFLTNWDKSEHLAVARKAEAERAAEDGDGKTAGETTNPPAETTREQPKKAAGEEG